MTAPVTLYFLGADDTHRIEEPRPIQFHRADDEPHPYALVGADEALAIAADAPDLYATKGTPVGEQEDEPPAPKTKPARKSAPKAADTPEAE